MIPAGMGHIPFDQLKTIASLQASAAYLMAPNGDPFEEAMVVMHVNYVGCVSGYDFAKPETLVFVMDPANGPGIAQAILMASVQAAASPKLDSHKE